MRDLELPLLPLLLQLPYHILAYSYTQVVDEVKLVGFGFCTVSPSQAGGA